MKIRPPHSTIQQQRLRSLVLYLIDSKQGTLLSVLHQMLYFIEFDYYEKNETHLIGGRFVKENGAELDCMDRLLVLMANSAEAHCIDSPLSLYPMTRWSSIKKPNVACFTDEELLHIDNEIERFDTMASSQIYDFLLSDSPVMTARDGEEIDYEMVFYRDDEHAVTENEPV